MVRIFFYLSKASYFTQVLTVLSGIQKFCTRTGLQLWAGLLLTKSLYCADGGEYPKELY